MQSSDVPGGRPLLTVAEAAARAGLSRSVGYSWVRAGLMPGAINVAGRWYVRTAVLVAWLAGLDEPGARENRNAAASAGG